VIVAAHGSEPCFPSQSARDAGMRVLVVDDHPLYRDGLAALLSASAHVTQAATGEEAVALFVEDPDFDVVLMDLAMPGVGGVEATRQICDRWPGTPVLVLTMLPDGDSVAAALSAGARGYLLKESAPDEILAAIAAVASGSFVMGADVAPIVIGRATSHVPPSHRIAGLTDREDEVLHLLSQGMGNREIAARLFLSDKTVRNYVSGLLTKLHVQDRAAAVAAARDAGYGAGHPREEPTSNPARPEPMTGDSRELR